MTRIEHVELIYDGWGRIYRLTLRETDGTTYQRQVEDHGNAVAVLPYDPGRRMVMLVRQMRAPALFRAGTKALIEAPAGMLEDDDNPAECARREAEEEVGLRLDALEPIGRFWTSPGSSTERVELFLAAYGEADRVAAGGGVQGENEQIEVLEFPIAEALSIISSGGIVDLKTLALLQALELRRPEICR